MNERTGGLMEIKRVKMISGGALDVILRLIHAFVSKLKAFELC